MTMTILNIFKNSNKNLIQKDSSSSIFTDLIPFSKIKNGAVKAIELLQIFNFMQFYAPFLKTKTEQLCPQFCWLQCDFFHF